MNKIVFNCDRCGQEVEGGCDQWFTAGYYNVSPDSDNPWTRFGRPGEERICDHCMWSDPEYQRIYGPRDAQAREWLESQQ